MGWQHAIAGGQGNLVASALKSPNFVHGATGWAINKNGTAEFHSVSLPAGSGGTVVTFASSAPASPNVGDVWYNTSAGLEASVWNGTTWAAYQIGAGAIASGGVSAANLSAAITARSLGGITTTIAASAPGSPNAGDIWINTANGYQLEQWNGSAWTPISWNAANVITAGTITASLIAAATITGSLIAAGTITAGNIAANTITATQIAANTITASQLAAGIVYAGIVNSTTITGAVINGGTFNGTNWVENSHGMFLYGGTPAAGNLIASIAPASGNDAAWTSGAGNNYLAGVMTYGPGNANTGMRVTSSGNQGFINFQTDTTYVGVGAGNPPSVFANTNNQGLTSEYEDIDIQSGSPTAHPNAQSKVILFGGSQDGTTSVPHVWITAGPSSNMVLDITTTGIFGADPANANVDEIWHNIGAASQPVFGTGFGAGTGVPRYRLEPIGGGLVRLDGTVNTTAATAAGATMFTLPAAYRPLANKRFVGVSNSSGYVASGPGATSVQITTSGLVQCVFACSASGQQIVLDGITFPVN